MNKTITNAQLTIKLGLKSAEKTLGETLIDLKTQQRRLKLAKARITAAEYNRDLKMLCNVTQLALNTAPVVSVLQQYMREVFKSNSDNLADYCDLLEGMGSILGIVKTISDVRDRIVSEHY